MGRAVRGMVLALVLTACGSPDPTEPADAGGDAGPPGCVIDLDCDDGLFCTGVERCRPTSELADGRGCVLGAEPACLEGQTCDEGAARCLTECDVSSDADGDGVAAPECGGSDCDDSDARRYPGNVEVCDADDRDEDCDPTTFGTRDGDRDTFHDAVCCNVASDGSRNCGQDCDDTLAGVSPLGAEICDGRDNDCDGAVDEDVLVAGFRDADGDQHGDPAEPVDACPGAPRFSTIDDDCDDSNNRVHAAQVEICDGADNDCDGRVDEATRPVTWYRDADGDGFGSAAGGTRVACEPPDGYELLPLDCDDERAGVSPLAVEACNGRDDDCNGRADYAIGPADFEDDDGDGFVDVACGGLGDDCDDHDPGVHPGAEPFCDGRDHDCDGAPDDGAPVSWWRDEDGDGFGAGTPVTSCEPPVGHVRRGGDCDDSRAARGPGQRDDCDGVDDDCDGEIDEDATRMAFYADADGDGAGGGAPVLACAQPAGHGVFPSDCDDGDPLRYEGAPELCDGRDDDCDGSADEAAEVICSVPGADASCVAGECVVDACRPGFASCDGSDANGCEVDTTTDAAHCGGCGQACVSGPGSTAVCSAGSCGLACTGTARDCDGLPETGCEAPVDDPLNCGACGRRCAPRAHAAATCSAGTCGIECEPGWSDCDGDLANGCEVNTAEDPSSCGACGRVCPLATDACVRGDCLAVPFASDGSEGALIVTADTVLPPGVHHYTTIHVHAGARVTTTGTGVLELRATGDVLIEGTIDVSGARGGVGNHVSGTAGTQPGADGGATGDPLGVGANGTTSTTCPAGGSGGIGAFGFGGSECGCGGRYGGGGGGAGSAGTGCGGGGYAGGGGGFQVATGGEGGAGGGISGESTGGTGMCGGGEPGAGVYAGGSCTPPESGGSGGGGGSIGAAAAADLAVATTFQPGSGGGGGAGGVGGAYRNGGGGGGGGGGAVRITSLTRIVVTSTGRVLANGGAGGNAFGATTGNGGGGSGGVVYLASPELEVHGVVTARGGAPGANASGAPGGAGGLGRVRLSVLPERCTLYGLWLPELVDGCRPTRTSPVPGQVYVDEYPF